MRSFLFALTFLLVVSIVPVSGQVLLSGGLGIDLTDNHSLNDYITVISFERRPDFNTNAEFFGEADYLLGNSHALGIEYAFSVNSYSNNTQGYYDLSWNFHMPSALYFYMLNGPGYKFKFGGGAGYRYAKMEESRGYYISPVSYSASGWGMLLRAEGNTSLGGSLYALIAAQLRWDFTGDLKNEGQTVVNPATSEKVNMSGFAVGLRLGVSYYF
ncbi:MAG: hypothetical protein ACM3Q2_01495 [Syntrophothermus sp.]